MQVNLNTNINYSRQNSKPNFGIKNNPNVAKKALEKTPVEIKDIIVKSINQFCDLTQQKGVKGDLFIKKVSCNNKTPQGIDYSFLEYSIKHAKTNRKSHHKVKIYNSTDQQSLVNKMLLSINIKPSI